MRKSSRHITGERGMTLLELLVSLAITSIFSAMMVRGLMTTASQSHDFEIMAQADERARTILDYMVYDLRVTGSGIPLMQSGFQIGDPALGTAPEPVLLDATSTHFHIRLNERGLNTVTTADYTPSSTSLSFPILDTSDYLVGDTLYLSDHSKGGTAGLRGVITQISGHTLTIANSYVSTAATTFKSGTIVHRVSDVIYDSPTDGSGITRSVGGVTQVLEEKSSFSISWVDANGTPVTMPLTDTTVKNTLAGVLLTVNVKGNRPLKSKSSYTATAEQAVAFRNLTLSR